MAVSFPPPTHPKIIRFHTLCSDAARDKHYGYMHALTYGNRTARGIKRALNRVMLTRNRRHLKRTNVLMKYLLLFYNSFRD
jgi:hypothetical protein